MIADLYKELKDCKDFFERCREPNAKIAVSMSYEELDFVYNLVELVLLIAKLSGGHNQ